MAAAPDEVVVAVAIDVVDERGNAGVARQVPVGVPLPAACATIFRSFEPAVRADDVASAVAVDVAEADAVAGDFDREIVADEAGRGGSRESGAGSRGN